MARMMSRRGEDKFPRFRTHVQTQFRTAPDRTSPVPPMASETRPSSSPIAALPTNTTHGHANSHFGLKQSAWHHVVFARASGNCFLGTCPVMRASSRGRCNTIQSVDPTILPPREPICPGVLDQDPSQDGVPFEPRLANDFWLTLRRLPAGVPGRKVNLYEPGGAPVT